MSTDVKPTGWQPIDYNATERLLQAHAEVTDERNKLREERDKLSGALASLIHRCDAEGCGTAWAPLSDAREVLAGGER